MTTLKDTHIYSNSVYSEEAFICSMEMFMKTTSLQTYHNQQDFAQTKAPFTNLISFFQFLCYFPFSNSICHHPQI